MRRALMAAMLLLILLPTTASAQRCDPGQIDQSDMAGVYDMPESPMTVRIAPCGAIFVVWSNGLGRHEAIYTSGVRLAGGEILAGVVQPDPWVGSLDNQTTVGIKPAEVGYIQVITFNRQEDWIKVYRLRQIA
jgi:hypothetical protein